MSSGIRSLLYLRPSTPPSGEPLQISDSAMQNLKRLFQSRNHEKSSTPSPPRASTTFSVRTAPANLNFNEHVPLPRRSSAKRFRLPNIPRSETIRLFGDDSDYTPPAPPEPAINHTTNPLASSIGRPIKIPRKPLQTWDPNAPLTNPSLHIAAKEVLKDRYRSKFEFDFTFKEGWERKDYDWIWVTKEELERKVVEDVVWVRKRYFQAGRLEPGDVDLVRWFEGDVRGSKVIPPIVVAEETPEEDRQVNRVSFG